MRTLIVAALLAAAAAGGLSAAATPIPGGWSPIKDISDPHIQELGGWAVAEHAKKVGHGGALRFREVVRGEEQVVAGMNYRLVLRAADAAGRSAAYQAAVYERVWTNTRELTSFTPAN